jgi:two-component system phosphate regulon response regulator PhoB
MVVQARSSVLIVADDVHQGATVCANLVEAGFRPIISRSCQHAESLICDAFDALLIADNNGCCNCVWTCRLRNAAAMRRAPLVVLPDEGLPPAADLTSTIDFPTRLKQFLDHCNESSKGARLEVRGITLGPIAHIVTHCGRPIHLRPVEFRLLAHFMRHPDKVFTSQQLLNEVWHRDSDPGRTVAMHVASLRKALKDRRSTRSFGLHRKAATSSKQA